MTGACALVSEKGVSWKSFLKEPVSRDCRDSGGPQNVDKLLETLDVLEIDMQKSDVSSESKCHFRCVIFRCVPGCSLRAKEEEFYCLLMNKCHFRRCAGGGSQGTPRCSWNASPKNDTLRMTWAAANGGVTNGGLRGVWPPFPEIGRNRPKSPFFCPFRPFPEGAKSTWEIQKTEEKGLFPQISSDFLKPPSLKPPFAALQMTLGRARMSSEKGAVCNLHAGWFMIAPREGLSYSGVATARLADINGPNGPLQVNMAHLGPF